MITIKNARAMTRRPLALRRMLLLGSMLGPLVPAAALANPPGATLPTGGVVRAGQAAVATSGGNALTLKRGFACVIAVWRFSCGWTWGPFRAVA